MTPDFDPDRESSGVLSIDALCCNRDLPAALPFGGGRPVLRLVEGAAAVTGLTCLTAPTPTLRLPLQERGFWRLISHLSLGHLSVVGGETAAEALREVLRLYDCRDTVRIARRHSRPARCHVARPAPRAFPGLRGPGARTGGFCRGLDVTLTFDEQVWTTGGLYVLASVLDRFLALHATVNSFVRTRAILRGRPERRRQLAGAGRQPGAAVTEPRVSGRRRGTPMARLQGAAAALHLRCGGEDSDLSSPPGRSGRGRPLHQRRRIVVSPRRKSPTCRPMPAPRRPRVTVGLIGLTGPVGVLPRRYSDAVVADQRSRSFSLTRFPRPDFASHGRGLRGGRREIPAASRRRCRRAGAGPAARRSGGRGAAGLDRLRDPAPGRAPAGRCVAVAPLRRFFLGPSALAGSARSPGLRLAGAAGQGRAVRRRLAGPAASISARACRWACRPARLASWVSTRRPACAPGTSRRESCCASGRSISPTSSGFCRISRCCASWSSLVRAFVGFEVGFAVNPVLARDAVPPLVMAPPGEPGAAGAGPLLGWNTWLPTSAITPRRTDARRRLVRGGNC